MKSIDLNADMGEGTGNDQALLDIVSSASIACGGHAGNTETMRATLKAARDRNVTCGAHPGFADPENFGRRRLNLAPDELQAQLREQLIAISEIAGSEGVPLKYVKLHGALANMAAEDPQLALSAFQIVKAHDPTIAILAQDNTAQITAANALGLKTIREAYADRRYDKNGLLVSRSEEGAVLTATDDVVAQCLSIARGGTITASDGTEIKTQAQSICLHGDTTGAVALAQKIHAALRSAQISVEAPVI